MMKKLLVKQCNDFASFPILVLATQIACSELNLPVVFEAQFCSKYSESMHGKVCQAMYLPQFQTSMLVVRSKCMARDDPFCIRASLITFIRNSSKCRIDDVMSGLDFFSCGSCLKFTSLLSKDTRYSILRWA